MTNLAEEKSTPSFENLGLASKVLDGLRLAGYTGPTPIQAAVIPEAIKGRDILGRAQTGSGKTAAFVVPTLHLLAPSKTAQVLVLVPTRELAVQVVNEYQKLGTMMGVRVASVIGGQSISQQVDRINSGAQVIIATPGRILDHLRSKRLKGFSPSTLVLDEADEMLNMGFVDDIKDILAFMPNRKQTFLFSATMPKQILNLTKQYLTEPANILLDDKKESHQDITQILYLVKPTEKDLTLLRVIEKEMPEKAIVFVKTKQDADELAVKLQGKKFKATAIHGDLRQASRLQAVSDLKNGRINLLIATDVASRGLDIADLSHVFNYHLPENLERYTHRIGRTGRAGNKGVAVTIATEKELRMSSIRSKLKAGLTIGVIPNKEDILAQRDQELIEKISEVEVSERAEKFLAKLIADGQLENLAKKMLSLLQQGYDVKGPDVLGYSQNELSRMESSLVNEARFRSSRGPSFSSFKPRFGGGRDRDRNQSSGGNKPPFRRRTRVSS